MSENCKYNPLELVLATTDSDLYDISNKKWRWAGPLYWAVECLDNRQSVISHNVVPNISPDRYLPIETSPTTWDYCKSKRCQKDSESMHIIFTFKPNSKDPEDFLQFVTDIYCHITDFPQNSIKDNAGKEWFITIEEVSKATRYPYVELWIADAHPGKKGTTTVHGSLRLPQLLPLTDQKPRFRLILGILVTLIFILIVAIVIYFILSRRRTKLATTAIPELNIG